jgi:hypothetical protein
MIKQAKAKQTWVVQGEAMPEHEKELYRSILTFAGLDMRPLTDIQQRFVEICERRWPVTSKKQRERAERDVSETLQRRGRVVREVAEIVRQMPRLRSGERLSRAIDKCLVTESEVANG